jgi:hypothetical protein
MTQFTPWQVNEAIRAAETEADKELAVLQPLCGKIVQAYRIRTRLFMQRYNLLRNLQNDYAKLASNPNFYNALNHILETEKKLLTIIEGSEKKVGNNLVFAITELGNWQQHYHSSNEAECDLLPALKCGASRENV